MKETLASVVINVVDDGGAERRRGVARMRLERSVIDPTPVV
jgi:hypothetical protein